MLQGYDTLQKSASANGFEVAFPVQVGATCLVWNVCEWVLARTEVSRGQIVRLVRWKQLAVVG